MNDPAGKEELNALTAAMIGEGGSQSHSYPEIVDILYPWAARIRTRRTRKLRTCSGSSSRPPAGILRGVMGTDRFGRFDTRMTSRATRTIK